VREGWRRGRLWGRAHPGRAGGLVSQGARERNDSLPTSTHQHRVSLWDPERYGHATHNKAALICWQTAGLLLGRCGEGSSLMSAPGRGILPIAIVHLNRAPAARSMRPLSRASRRSKLRPPPARIGPSGLPIVSSARADEEKSESGRWQPAAASAPHSSDRQNRETSPSSHLNSARPSISRAVNLFPLLSAPAECSLSR
jgi:hypothetical protein